MKLVNSLFSRARIYSFFFVIVILISEIEENVLELLECNDSILLDVMLYHDLVELFLCNLVPDLVHGSDDVFFGDNT
jgi:hypothetical protein